MDTGEPPNIYELAEVARAESPAIPMELELTTCPACGWTGYAVCGCDE